MALKKQERKDSYKAIQALLLGGKNKEAFDKLCMMCADDVGVYFLGDYDEIRKKVQG